jgi:hypothetical protein
MTALALVRRINARSWRLPDGEETTLADRNGVAGIGYHEWAATAQNSAPSAAVSIALGKKSSGRLLDGRLHDGFPQHVIA